MIPQQTHKRCSHCQGWLPFEALGPNRRMKSGLNSWCRKCHLDATQKWRAEHREEINARRREAYASPNPDSYPTHRVSAGRAA
jgi:hypothetical protein